MISIIAVAILRMNDNSYN